MANTLGRTSPHSDTLGKHFAPALMEADVEEFRTILREESGEDLDLAQAWTRATEVLALFRYLLLPPAASGQTGFEPPAGS